MQTFEKILIGIIFIVLVGFNAFFIVGKQQDILSGSSVINAKKAAIDLQNEVTEEKAKSIALGVANGKITEVEEKTVNGRSFYEIEIDNGIEEIEIKIDKRNGDILQTEREEKEGEDEQVTAEELTTIKGILTEEQAKAIALDAIPGSVIGVEAEREAGHLIFGVEIAAQGDVAEVEVDAETGEILEIEWGED